MKQSDIPEDQIKRAVELIVEASRQLRDEHVGRFWDNDYVTAVERRLTDGRGWRSLARIHSVEDARRELLGAAERLG